MKIACEKCGGTGVEAHQDHSPSVLDCAFCDGEGEVNEGICDICDKNHWTHHGFVSGVETYACNQCAGVQP